MLKGVYSRKKLNCFADLTEVVDILRLDETEANDG